MDINQNNFNHYDMVMWDMIRSLNDVKECVKNSEENRHDDLICLQNELMEAGEWLNQLISE